MKESWYNWGNFFHLWNIWKGPLETRSFNKVWKKRQNATPLCNFEKIMVIVMGIIYKYIIYHISIYIYLHQTNQSFDHLLHVPLYNQGSWTTQNVGRLANGHLASGRKPVSFIHPHFVAKTHGPILQGVPSVIPG